MPTGRFRLGTSGTRAGGGTQASSRVKTVHGRDTGRGHAGHRRDTDGIHDCYRRVAGGTQGVIGGTRAGHECDTERS